MDFISPNVLIAGCFKCGTTYLHSIMIANESVYSPHVKEQNFFLDAVYDHVDLDLSSAGEKLTSAFQQGKDYPFRLESSPCYLYLSRSKISKLIKFYDQDTKFIFIIRRPSERIRSFHQFSTMTGRDLGTFDEFTEDVFANQGLGALERGDAAGNSFKESNYSFYIKNWQAELGEGWRERMLVLSFEEMITQQDSFLLKLQQFLALNHSLCWPAGERQNASAVVRSRFIHSIYRSVSMRFNSKLSKFVKLKYTLKAIYAWLNYSQERLVRVTDIRYQALDRGEQAKLQQLGISVNWMS
jgi:hypothetical protein